MLNSQIEQYGLRTYQSVLKEFFLQKKEKNNSFSIRSFAKLVDLSPSFMSLLFNGKRELNLQTAEQIANKLSLKNVEKKYFLNLVDYQTARTETSKEKALSQLQKLSQKKIVPQQMEMDVFLKLSNWHYNAILAFLTLPHENKSIRQIARRFKLDNFYIEECLERLKRLNLVECQNGQWKNKNAYLEVKSIPSVALRKYQKSILELATKSLEEQKTFEERDISSVVFTVDATKLPLAQKLISEFQDQLVELLDSPSSSEVYQCAIQFFRVTEPKGACHE